MRSLPSIYSVSVPRSLPWRESLGREENVGFDLVRYYLCPSSIEGGTAEGVGLQVANSHTGNHREDDFTPLETIRRFIGVIRSRSLSKGGLRAGSEAYGGEPNVDLLRAFLNLGYVGNWLTLSNRSDLSVPKVVTKPITHIEGWKGSFFYIENKIVPFEYPELILEENKLKKKSFKDVIPQYAREDPLYNQITAYPANVQTFPDPILYLVGLKTSWEHSPKKPIIFYRGREMDFRSFMMEGVDGEFYFSPEGGVGDEEGSSPSTMSVNNETSVIDTEPLTSVPPSQFAENSVDSDDAPSERGEVILVDCVVTDKVKNRKVDTSLKASKASGDPSNPLDVDSDPDIYEFPSAKELKDSVDCHWVVAHVTPPSWKQHLKEISLEKLCDIHDKAYMWQVVLDNVINKKTYELMSTLTKARAACDANWERERKKDKAYAELKVKCNDALQDLDKNPLVLDMRAEIESLQGQVDKPSWERLKKSETQLLQENDGLKHDRVEVVVKVVPHVATKLVHGDEMGLLVARLVKTDLVHGRGFASTHFVNYSIATTRNLAPPRAISRGPTISIPHWEKGHTKVMDVMPCFGLIGTDE
ncbi:hypothetical protein Tco_0909742 [Tanacetum coccineum]|uniref:Uncharacterized protein n=1 Tax=Tanacetum coccineum TaxID=301880 RepID=A0ABQ5CST0_9ASTR